MALGGAALLGSIAGVLSAGQAPALAPIRAAAHDAAVGIGLTRRRPPQPGDYWPGCNDARAAGTAPIYRGEPGYRTKMDGDLDGVACEPIP
jgi:hypothetical protein